MGKSPFQSMLAPFRVLVVDPSDRNQAQFTKALAVQPCELCFAREGIEALTKIDEWSPHLIFVSASTPRVDGYRLTQVIRNNKLHANTPVVLLSRDADLFDRARGRLVGASDQVNSPLTEQAIVEQFTRFSDQA